MKKQYNLVFTSPVSRQLSNNKLHVCWFDDFEIMFDDFEIMFDDCA